MTYFGVFESLHSLNLPGTVEQDLYEGYFAKLYVKVMEEYPGNNIDSEVYVQQAGIVGSPVLELACGAGRVALNLAARGFSVTGVDLSPHMLELFREKLKYLPNRVKNNIKLNQGDMARIKLNETFNLAILPATSICLLKSEEELELLFETVYDHLSYGGRFVFDYRLFPETDQTMPIQSITWRDEENNSNFVLFQEKVDLNYHRSVMNFYAEEVNTEKCKRYFGNTVKVIFSDKAINSAISKTKFHIYDSWVVDLGVIKNRMLILEK